MKTMGYLVLAAVAAMSGFAQAQAPSSGGSGLTPYVPPPIPYAGGYGDDWFYGASTPFEGVGRGIAAVIRAKGQYNLATSAAAVNFSEAYRRSIENAKLWTQTYYEMRELNRQERDAAIKRARGNPEDFVRYAQAGKPKPLSNRDLDAVTGQIRWPVLLTAGDFDPQRNFLEKAFAARAYHGVLRAEDFVNTIRVIDQMTDGLKQRIDMFPPQEYVEAKRFLRSLAYEARMPAG
jgi:hypothetical protein